MEEWPGNRPHDEPTRSSPQRMVDALVGDLAPVRPASSLPRAATLILVVVWATVGALVFRNGALRADALGGVFSSPHYALELVVGILTGVTALLAGLEWGVPGSRPSNLRVFVPLTLMATWIGLVVWEMRHPIQPPSMAGKRPGCEYEVVLFALPAVALAVYAISRRALYGRVTSGALLGLAAGSIPAVWMQLACRYDPAHVLSSHLAPIAAVVLTGAIAARGLLSDA